MLSRLDTKDALIALIETPDGKRELAVFLRMFAEGIDPDAQIVDVVEMGAILRFASRLDAEADDQEATEERQT